MAWKKSLNAIKSGHNQTIVNGKYGALHTFGMAANKKNNGHGIGLRTGQNISLGLSAIAVFAKGALAWAEMYALVTISLDLWGMLMAG